MVFSKHKKLAAVAKFALRFVSHSCLILSCTRMQVLPTKDPVHDKRYLSYITSDKVGMHIMPLDGNPHNAMALIAHPSGVSGILIKAKNESMV